MQFGSPHEYYKSPRYELPSSIWRGNIFLRVKKGEFGLNSSFRKPRTSKKVANILPSRRYYFVPKINSRSHMSWSTTQFVWSVSFFSNEVFEKNLGSVTFWESTMLVKIVLNFQLSKVKNSTSKLSLEVDTL